MSKTQAVIFFSSLSVFVVLAILPDSKQKGSIEISPSVNGFFTVKFGKHGMVCDSGMTVGEIMKEVGNE